MTIAELIDKTRQNLLHLYMQIKNKYSEGDSLNIVYNGYVYTGLNKTSKDDYLIKDFCEKIPFPYPFEVMTYIKQVDEFIEDKRILQTLLIKASNMYSSQVRNSIANNIEIFSDLNNIELYFNVSKESLYDVLNNSPEAVEVIKKFNVNNLLL